MITEADILRWVVAGGLRGLAAHQRKGRRRAAKADAFAATPPTAVLAWMTGTQRPHGFRRTMRWARDPRVTRAQLDAVCAAVNDALATNDNPERLRLIRNAVVQAWTDTHD